MSTNPASPSRLLNGTQLCEATGFSRFFVGAVLSQDNGPSKGGRFCSAEAFNAWVLAHPDFRPTYFWKTREGSSRPMRFALAKLKRRATRGFFLDQIAEAEEWDATPPPISEAAAAKARSRTRTSSP